MDSKVFSDGLPSYIMTTRPVLEIFKMAGYFPDSPRIYTTELCHLAVPPAACICVVKITSEALHWFTGQMVRTLLPRATGYSSISCNHEQEATLEPSEIIFEKYVIFITPLYLFGL